MKVIDFIKELLCYNLNAEIQIIENNTIYNDIEIYIDDNSNKNQTKSLAFKRNKENN